MESSIENAFILLVIGMVTVFVILSLVVLTGISIIKIINRYTHAIPLQKKGKSTIPPNTIAAIAAVVDQITQGQGKVENIQKL